MHDSDDDVTQSVDRFDTLTLTLSQSENMSEILDPSALLSSLPKYLPIDKELKNPQDALAVLIHTILSDLAFRLVGIDEDSSPSTYEGNVLPEEWNKHSPGNYTFRYRHEQSSLEFLVKISKLSNRTLIHAIASEVRVVEISV